MALYVVVEAKDKDSQPFRVCSGILTDSQEIQWTLENLQRKFKNDKTVFTVMTLVP
jgi:hypothetical protein